MSLNLQHKDHIFGQTVINYIKTVSGELPVDAVGLWQIVSSGRERFGLNDEDLTEFVSRSVGALLGQGAKPVIGGAGSKYDWILQPQYGETTKEIVDAVLKEWLASGAKDGDPGGLMVRFTFTVRGKRVRN